MFNIFTDLGRTKFIWKYIDQELCIELDKHKYLLDAFKKKLAEKQ